MPEINYNFNSLYVCLLLIIYNIWKTNYEYINIIVNKLYLLNYTSFIIMINICGLYLILTKISFEINIKCSVMYK
jgi:hypothetical protein